MPLSEREVTTQLLTLLDEAFDNTEASWTYYTESSATAGFLGALSATTVENANGSPLSTSLAAEVQHVTFAMNVAGALIRGEEVSVDAQQWRESWKAAELDETAWLAMQGSLRRAYGRLRLAIERHATAGAASFAHASGVVAHVAYHLGSVKQKIAAIRVGDGS